MSLNGLDAPEVLEAHQNTINDPGGWFLLKYVSRDGVELHGRGRGGVHEARQSIADYQDASPLYGLLIYRRRKVLIKYVPSGTSRVLQARTAVHFQDVTERYAPYDTLLEITTAEGLNDTALAASFPLHTASVSASSNRLHEISEDAEDPGASPRRFPVTSQTSTPSGARQYKTEKRAEQFMRTSRAAPPPAISVAAEAPAHAPGKTSISQILVREDSGKRSITSLGSPLAESVNSHGTAPTELSSLKDSDSKASFADEPVKPQPPRIPVSSQRPGTQGSNNTATGVEPLLEDSSLEQSASPGREADFQDRMNKALEEPFDFSYLEKKKVKLGPRPVQAKRATTTGVSALPAHYRPQQRKTDIASLAAVPPTSISTYSTLPLPPIPPTAEYNPRPISRGSVKSLPSSKNTTMTPDKLRLLKAVELRKRQLRKSSSQLPAVIPGVESEAPEVPKLPEAVPELAKQEVKETRAEELRNAAIAEQAVANKADSGIEMNYHQTTERNDAPSSVAAPAESKSADKSPDTTNSADPTLDETPQEVADEGAVPAEEPVNPATAQALRNDELRAEAEGYGAIPAPSPDDNETAMSSYGSARGDEFSPGSVYSDAADLPEAAVEPAQSATAALTEATQDMPELITSPATPMDAEHPLLPPAEVTGDVENSDEEDGEVSASPRRRGDLAKRRRGIVEPLQLETQNELLSDEGLMDELSDATVQEARPLAVAKSPIHTYFARRPSNQSLVSAQSEQSPPSKSVKAERAPISQSEDRLAEPPSSNHRSISPVGSSDTFAGLRGKVGAGITKRFQALTEGNREGATTPSTASPTASMDGSPNERRRGTHRSRAGSFKGRWGIGDRSSSVTTVASTAEHAATWSVSQDSNNRDSVHVRARIIRPVSSLDTHDEKPDAEEAAKADKLPALDTSIPESDDTLTAMSPTSRRNRNPSITTPQPEEASNAAKRASDGGDDASTIASNTTSSRTSRFFKRMSVLGGGNKRRSIIAPSSAAQSIVNVDIPSKSQSRRTSNANDKDRSDMPPAAALGDLNVQFPDTLLWKRRWLTLDEAGNLVLGIPQGQEHRGAVGKKHHLSEFKLPYMPDLDRQEIPHSICLDFLEDGTLQIACEDAMGQRQVLSMLRSYWKSWTS